MPYYIKFNFEYVTASIIMYTTNDNRCKELELKYESINFSSVLTRKYKFTLTLYMYTCLKCHCVEHISWGHYSSSLVSCKWSKIIDVN